MSDAAKVIDLVVGIFAFLDIKHITEDHLKQLPFDEEDVDKAIRYLLDEGFMKVYIKSKRGLTMYERDNVSAHQILRWERAKALFDF